MTKREKELQNVPQGGEKELLHVPQGGENGPLFIPGRVSLNITLEFVCELGVVWVG